jgi:hypothetical protein
MLAAATPVFLLIPEPGATQRILHPGTVIEANGSNFMAVFEEPIQPDIDADVVAFGTVGGKFFQQGAVVTEQRDLDDRKVLAFAKVGEVTSAEQRQTYRVSFASLDMAARVDKEKNCHVVDVSPEGFAAIADGPHKLGSIVQVSIACDQQVLSASARVQTIQERFDGKCRYGFLIPKSNIAARKMLEQISGVAQRAQLRRKWILPTRFSRM